MKNKISSVLVVLYLCGVICGCAEQTKEPEEPEKQAEPLILETEKWNPQGVFEGTIVLDGGDIEGGSYEGMIYIEMDGERVQITCTDAVKNAMTLSEAVREDIGK